MLNPVSCQKIGRFGVGRAWAGHFPCPALAAAERGASAASAAPARPLHARRGKTPPQTNAPGSMNTSFPATMASAASSSACSHFSCAARMGLSVPSSICEKHSAWRGEKKTRASSQGVYRSPAKRSGSAGLVMHALGVRGELSPASQGEVDLVGDSGLLGESALRGKCKFNSPLIGS